jgi:hypothetical protein
MAVSKGSFPITPPSQEVGRIDSGIYSNFAKRADYSPTSPSPIRDGNVAWSLCRGH